MELMILHTHTPAYSQDRDLAVVAPPVLRLLGRRPPHQGPLLLAAAGADVLVAADAADGVQVAAGVLGSSRGRVRRHGGHRRGGGAHRGGGERRAENRLITSSSHWSARRWCIYIIRAFVMDLGQCRKEQSYLLAQI